MHDEDRADLKKTLSDRDVAVTKCMEIDYGWLTKTGDLHYHRAIILARHLPTQFFIVQVSLLVCNGAGRGHDAEEQNK
ncbi:hypothetical protein JYP46_21200 [Nitratireductor aquimarinus]|uniref:hypothetical protein n=1 Tax=Alphaproteobacteria TaxID=28211 RepID=UPI0019D40D5F|nr:MULTISPECIES: hypothetical protein [Alphaproteobacteria]MBN7759346.1 hypothetical protein [Nitratireductor aquimarinus]MBY6002143.1 hypothetical protein [Tritonibacter mobilis]MBY6024596.1 hypothetical protein [Nitratireductor sp. DP7N14-4]